MSAEQASLPAATEATGTTRTHDIAAALRNALKMSGSLIVTWSVALIVKLQVPAHLGPVRQGHFGFAESFAAMFFSAIGLGVDTYIMKEVSVRPKHASDFVGSVFALRTVLGVALFGAMLATLWATGRTAEIQYAATVFGLTQFVMSFNATLGYILQATTKVNRLAIANVAAKIVWGAGLLVGLHFNAPLYVLAMPILVSELLRSAVLVPASRSAADLHYRLDLRALRPVLVASIPFFVSSIALQFSNNLSMSALEFIRKDEREVGWFAATQNLATLAMLLSPLMWWVVMPLLSRSHARAEEEMLTILRRCIDGLVIVIAPITIFISLSSSILIRLAFGDKYAPASLGLSILSMVFVVTYINMLLCAALVVLGKSWSVTMVSLGGIVTMSVFMVIFVPLGRSLFHTGGECAGAALAFIVNEACVILALLSCFRSAPLDARNVRMLAKTLVMAASVMVVDRFLLKLGPVRLVLDFALYVALALVLRVIRRSDVKVAVDTLRAGRGKKASP